MMKKIEDSVYSFQGNSQTDTRTDGWTHRTTAQLPAVVVEQESSAAFKNQLDRLSPFFFFCCCTYLYDFHVIIIIAPVACRMP